MGKNSKDRKVISTVTENGIKFVLHNTGLIDIHCDGKVVYKFANANELKNDGYYFEKFIPVVSKALSEFSNADIGGMAKTFSVLSYEDFLSGDVVRAVLDNDDLSDMKKFLMIWGFVKICPRMTLEDLEFYSSQQINIEDIKLENVAPENYLLPDFPVSRPLHSANRVTFTPEDYETYLKHHEFLVRNDPKTTYYEFIYENDERGFTPVFEDVSLSLRSTSTSYIAQKIINHARDWKAYKDEVFTMNAKEIRNLFSVLSYNNDRFLKSFIKYAKSDRVTVKQSLSHAEYETLPAKFKTYGVYLTMSELEDFEAVVERLDDKLQYEIRHQVDRSVGVLLAIALIEGGPGMLLNTIKWAENHSEQDLEYGSSLLNILDRPRVVDKAMLVEVFESEELRGLPIDWALSLAKG